MRTIICWIGLINIGLIHSFSLFQKPRLLKRLVPDSGLVESNIPCIHMESFAGDYWYTSPGSHEVCGLYLIGLPNQLIQLEFTHFDIDCSTGGLLAIVDGWELQGQYFPSDYDHPKSNLERYQEYCGHMKPEPIILSSQNAALIQFRLPVAGQGFRVKVTMPTNPQPCNVVSMIDEGTFTLKNYGKRVNCSMSIIFPEIINLLSIDVGETAEIPTQTKETGLTLKCRKRGRRDYVELLDGNGLDPRMMWREAAVCGLSSSPVPAKFVLGCRHSVVRLVSSGKFYNSVTFSYTPPTENDLEGRLSTCKL